MFEFPGAKRVRRSDLQSRRSSRSPSPPDSAAATYAANALQNIFSSIETYTPPTLQATHPAPDLERIQDEEEEQEFEFRLFHAPPAREGKCLSGHDQGVKPSDESEGEHNGRSQQIDMKDAGIRKFRIKLRSPTPTANDAVGGFVTPFRGWEYYFSDPEWARRKMAGDRIEARTLESDTLLKERFVDAAVSGETILEWATKCVWPGCHLPWRVIHLQTTSSQNKSIPSDSSQTKGVTLLNPLTVTKAPKSRKKPGKKRRIVLRRRLAATRTAEVAEREKRTKRNREKKIKKKLREKEKKATLRDGRGEQGGNAGREAMNNEKDD